MEDLEDVISKPISPMKRYFLNLFQKIRKKKEKKAFDKLYIRN